MEISTFCDSLFFKQRVTLELGHRPKILLLSEILMGLKDSKLAVALAWDCNREH